MSAKQTNKNSEYKKPGKTKAFFICLLIASFFWLIHALNTVYTQNFIVPVSFINVPQSKKPLEPLPDHISIDVKASGLKLSYLLLNKPFKELEIDFNNLKSINRNQCYILSSSKLNLNSIFKIETQIKNVLPDSLYFSENTGLQKTVPVKVPLAIKCRNGFGYLKPNITPSQITIWGDTNIVSQTDTIYTAPLNLIDLHQTVNKTVNVLKSNLNLYSNTNEISVSVNVNKLLEQTITIPIKSIHESSEEKVNIFPSQVKIRFTSLQNNFENHDTALFKALVDYKKPNKRNHKYPVFLGTIPNNITVMDINPKEVEILIFK